MTMTIIITARMFLPLNNLLFNIKKCCIANIPVKFKKTKNYLGKIKYPRDYMIVDFLNSIFSFFTNSGILPFT